MSKQPNPSGFPEDDIINPKLNVSCLDFLLIELVPLAQRITDQLHAREQALIEEFRKSKILNNASASTTPAAAAAAPASSSATHQQQGQQQQLLTPAASTTTPAAATIERSAPATTTTTTSIATGAANTTTSHMDNDETREAVFWRLDGLGYRVGQGLVERHSILKPRPQTPLDAIKFICKDLWTILFRKQIDNLKTNHRGVFVLTDARFQPMSRMSVDRRAGPKAGEEALRRAYTYLYFPCGVIRGALQGLGLDVTVTAETTEIPSATFQIKTKGAKP